MKRAVVLTSRLGPDIAWLRPGAAPTGIAVDYVDADAGIPALDGYDAAVNAMGRYFEEASSGALEDFYRAGGLIVHLTPDALTVPYRMQNGEPEIFPEQVDLIRTVGCVDLYVPVQAEKAACRVEAASPRYAALAKILDSCDDAADWRSANYNLGRGAADESGVIEPKLHIAGRIVPAVSLRNADGRVQAQAVVKTVRPGEGSMLYFNFTSRAFWENPATEEAFWALVREEAENTCAVYAEAAYARYLPGEVPSVYVSVQETGRPGTIGAAEVRLRVTAAPSYAAAQWRTVAEKTVQVACGETVEVPLPVCPEGACRIDCTANGETVTTGFYVLSDEAIAQVNGAFPRMCVDKAVSTEFHVQGGGTAPVHGTTYFVTDMYRSCFMHMNAWLCDRDMRRLAGDGFNLIRTGMWHNALAFYGESGEISERGIRALQAFFFTAAQQGITVQFVLGNVEMNDWDKSKSALHDPETRGKCFRMLTHFFKAFAAYANVQMDIINEPSYSARSPWTTGRPAHDPAELKNWRAWLRARYAGDISALRARWGRCAARCTDFDVLPLPGDDAFFRTYNRTTVYEFHAVTADFFAFARESYSGWCRSIRELGRTYAPDMVVLMGRDESIRIPCEQDEYFAGNVDTVNWHQWQKNGIVFAEFALNKVPDSICCGQELGVYQMEDHRGFKRLRPEQIGAVLERKLLYAFGNWVQWQWKNDPYLPEISENTLGIVRADGTETPGLNACRRLAAAEQRMAPYMGGRDTADSPVVIVHPSSNHFSCDQAFAEESVRTAIELLGFDLKEHFVVALEHTLQHYAPKSKKLYIVPSACRLREETWALLLRFAEAGSAVLITGPVEQDEFYCAQSRMTALDPALRVQGLRNVERTDAGEIGFYRIMGGCDAMHALDKYAADGAAESRLRTYAVGKGTVYCHPLPLELGDDKRAAAALYRRVLRDAGLGGATFRLLDEQPSRAVLVRAQRFDRSIAYTLVNEGEAAELRLEDTETGRRLNCRLDAGHGVKFWLGRDGALLETFLGGESALTAED